MTGMIDHRYGFNRKRSRGHRICAENVPVRPQPLLLLLLLLILSACAPSQERDWEGVAVTGRLLDQSGGFVPDAHVYAYGEDKANTLGPADVMSEPSQEDGNYLIILPAGTYTLVARKRLSGSISGPVRNGDLVGRLPEPLRAASGHLAGVNITLNTFRQGAKADPKRILTTDTRIKGVVVDDAGAVVPGISVFAYKGHFRQDPPDFMAVATDQRGRFEISLPGDGVYTVGARTGFGGKPGPEDRMGFWGEKDRPRRIEEGSVTEGVRIVVSPYGGTGTR